MELITVGYVRVSTPKQKIERQIANIKHVYPDAYIVKDYCTGTKLSRPGFERLLQMVDGKYLSKGQKVGRIVFDEVSRMSRNAAEGFRIYRALFEKGVELCFLKEPQVNTATYKAALDTTTIGEIKTGNKDTDEFVKAIGNAVNSYILALAEQQIKIAFMSAQKERDFLSQRTKEGMIQARANGAIIGRRQGTSFRTRKYKKASQIILKHYRGLGGDLTAQQVADMCKIAKSTVFKYIKDMEADGLIT